MAIFLDRIKEILSTPLRPDAGNTTNGRLASVLILIYGPTPHVLMTKKSSILKTHAGEIAFPGGKYEAGDLDLLDTALRESREEINLSITREHVIGQLKPVTTLNSGYSILPFISVVKRLPRLKDNPEVESILSIPLFSFLKTLSPDPDPEHQSIKEMYVFKYKHHLVWGASARMLKQIVDVFKSNNIL